MSRDLENEIILLKAQCNKYKGQADKYKRKFAKKKRPLKKVTLLHEDTFKMLVEDQEIKLDMLKEHESMMQQMAEASDTALHEVGDTAIRVIESHIANNDILKEKNLKGVRAANEKKANLRNTAEKYVSMYKLYIELYQQGGYEKRRCEQKARKKVADVVEEKTGKRPGKSFLYDLFPKDIIP